MLSTDGGKFLIESSLPESLPKDEAKLYTQDGMCIGRVKVRGGGRQGEGSRQEVKTGAGGAGLFELSLVLLAP